MILKITDKEFTVENISKPQVIMDTYAIRTTDGTANVVSSHKWTPVNIEATSDVLDYIVQNEGVNIQYIIDNQLFELNDVYVTEDNTQLVYKNARVVV